MKYTNFSCEIFCGFYETEYSDFSRIWEIEGDIEYPLEFDVRNYTEYENEVARLHTDYIFDQVKNKGIVSNMKFLEVDSPQFYNYRTDRLVIDVDLDEDKLKEYCFKTKRNEFSQYLKENWTSRSGFWSFITNNISDFELEDKSENKEVMLEFYLLQEVDFDDIFESMIEDVDNLMYEHTCVYNNETRKYYDYTIDDNTGKIVPLEEIKQ